MIPVEEVGIGHTGGRTCLAEPVKQQNSKQLFI
jgi:hypothetical protein